MKKTDKIERINKYTIIVGHFNTLLSTIDRTRQKISKNIGEINTTVKQQQDLINICTTLYPKTANVNPLQVP